VGSKKDPPAFGLAEGPPNLANLLSVWFEVALAPTNKLHTLLF